MPLLKVIWWLVMLLPRIFWFLVKCIARIITFGQFDPWKRAPMQQMEDITLYSVQIYTARSLLNKDESPDKKRIKAALKDSKVAFKYLKKYSKWPRWLDKDFGEDRITLGLGKDKSRRQFLKQARVQAYQYGSTQHLMIELVCSEKALEKLKGKLTSSELEYHKRDLLPSALKNYGDAFYNACAKEGVNLVRTNCDCGCPIRGIRKDLSLPGCCSEKLEYSAQGKKKIYKAMAITLKKKEFSRDRVKLEGGEFPKGYDRSDDNEDELCGSCGEVENECECDEFQEPDTNL